jgi:hypothetical protein
MEAVLLITPAWAFDSLNLDGPTPHSLLPNITAQPVFTRAPNLSTSRKVRQAGINSDKKDEEITFGFHLDTDEFLEVFKTSWQRSGIGIYVVLYSIM